jgi:Flp pilus assembly protein CpaB
MQSRTPILAAVVAGIAAVFLMQLHISDIREQSRPDLARVMVASTELRPGMVLEGKHIAMAAKARNSLPALAIRWEERNLYLGQEIQFKVGQGDYVLASYFGTAALAAARLSDKIDPKLNQRAMTIPVSNVTSLENSIRPADRIDLLLTYSALEPDPQGATRASPKLVTTPLLENVYVLATGGFGSTGGPGGYGTITLLVDSDQAKLLIWAMRQGDLSILLRNQKDLEKTDRAFIKGDTALLGQLGAVPVRPGDVVARSRTAAE